MLYSSDKITAQAVLKFSVSQCVIVGLIIINEYICISVNVKVFDSKIIVA
jgi:hypothetical protein